MDLLTDQYGRTFEYLRLSVTDACNFRCRYCLPQGYLRPAPSGDLLQDLPLSPNEIENLIGAFAALGFKKVRLSGGEPTLRRDITEIVSRVSRIPGIQTVALTTNGYRLDKLAPELKRAGLSLLNLSLDSLNPAAFRKITGSNAFDRIKQGLHAALDAGFVRTKINVVMLRSFFEDDFDSFVELVRTAAVTVRFIELMQTLDNREYYEAEHLSGDDLRLRLGAMGWHEMQRSSISGPAREFSHPDYAGALGIIAPYFKDFCRNCNRLRVSSRGALRLCLFGDGQFSLRALLQQPAQRAELLQTIHSVISSKPAGHRLHQQICGSTAHLASIGG